MKMKYISFWPYQWLYVLAFLVTWIYVYRGYTLFKGLAFFLSYSFLMHMVFIPLSIYLFRTNMELLNIYAVSCVGFYFYIYINYFNSNNQKSLARKVFIIAMLWVFMMCLRFIYVGDISKIDSYAYTSGMIVICGIILRYFYGLIYQEAYRELKNDSLIYFSFGLLIFTVTSFPTLIFINVGNTIPLQIEELQYSLLLYANIILGLGYLLSLLCLKKI